MIRKLTTLLAALALWAALPAASQAQTHGCACLFNQAGVPIQFQYKWGDQPFQVRTIQAGMVYSFCWQYQPGSHTSPPLHFMLNRAVGGGAAFTDYSLPRVQSSTTICEQVPSAGHYHVTFQPGTNNQFLHVVKGRGTAAAPPQPGPAPAPPGPAPGQAAFGCACVNNGVDAPVQFQFKWGNDPFKTQTLLPGHVFPFCWPYGSGVHTSPPLHFMLNRAVGGSTAFTDYALVRVQSPTNQCAGVPKDGQYWVRFQPGTNNQFLHLVKQ